MEEADVLLHKCNTELLSSLEYWLVILASAGSSNVLNTRSRCPVNVVCEGELWQSVRKFRDKCAALMGK